MNKYTIALLLWKHDPNPQGHYPIYIRVTIDRQRSYIATGYFLAEKYWDEKGQRLKDGHAHAAVINPDITNRKNMIMHYIVQQQMHGKGITAAWVKDHFAGGKDMHNIFDFITEQIKSVRHKREGGTLVNYDKYRRKLELYVGSTDLSFEQIDQGWLQQFENSLRNEGLDNNYVHANLVALRTMFNAARKKQIITHYPFAHYEMPIYEQKDKDYLSMKELNNLEKYADQETAPTLKQTAVYFLLGCYTGLRISDWFRFDIAAHVHAGNVRLRAKKNGEWVLMPISAPLKRNIARMQATPLTISEPEINRSLKDIAKKIEARKYLTTHSGRHTFAVTICAEQGIGLEVCAELMGITVATCQKAYYRVTKTKIAKECNERWKGLI
ncbi:MAG TPA: site-specific integrase [Gammaproteobacteria bacterium]|nr:site-specific integrase [Gammaproteobacteria bacterium]